MERTRWIAVGTASMSLAAVIGSAAAIMLALAEPWVGGSIDLAPSVVMFIATGAMLTLALLILKAIAETERRRHETDLAIRRMRAKRQEMAIVTHTNGELTIQRPHRDEPSIRRQQLRIRQVGAEARTGFPAPTHRRQPIAANEFAELLAA